MADNQTITIEKQSDAVFDGYLTETEYAQQRGVSLRTCQRDRALRQGPPHIVIGKKVYYRLEAVKSWLLEQEQHTTRSLVSKGGRHG